MAKRRRRLRKSIVYALAAIAVLILGLILWAILRKPKTNPEEPTGGMATPDAPEIHVTEEPTPDPNAGVKEERASLFLTGDALLHESVYKDAEKEGGGFDFGKQLNPFLKAARPYDLQYFNQETLIGGTELGLSGYPTFNSPKEFAQFMLSNGFNLVSTANNHCLDKGEAGIISAKKWYDTKKDEMIMQGINLSQEEYDEIATGEVNGITYAFLSYCEHTNGIAAPHPYSVNYYPGHEQEMLDKVKKADSMVDVVIVAMHWGTEYSHDVNESQMSLAEQLTEAGADIIVGNHPHDIQPFKWVNDRPVFFAMGNLISTQIEVDNRIGMVAGLDIVKRTNPDGTVEISYENVRADLTFTYTEGEYPALRTNVTVYPFSMVTDQILPDHEAIYEQYKAIITKLDSNIQIGGV